MARPRIRNIIRQLRFEQGEMTQQELADRVGCTRQTIVMLEAERYSPSLALALGIAKILGRTVDEIFELEASGRPEA